MPYNPFVWFFLFVMMVPLTVVLLIVVFGISVDSLFSLGADSASLTCFHCGAETPAKAKTCSQCGEELQ